MIEYGLIKLSPRLASAPDISRDWIASICRKWYARFLLAFFFVVVPKTVFPSCDRQNFKEPVWPDATISREQFAIKTVIRFRQICIAVTNPHAQFAFANTVSCAFACHCMQIIKKRIGTRLNGSSALRTCIRRQNLAFNWQCAMCDGHIWRRRCSISIPKYAINGKTIASKSESSRKQRKKNERQVSLMQCVCAAACRCRRARTMNRIATIMADNNVETAFARIRNRRRSMNVYRVAPTHTVETAEAANGRAIVKCRSCIRCTVSSEISFMRCTHIAGANAS